MLSVRDAVENVLGWRLFKGQVNLWWDNWSGLGTLGRVFPYRGVAYARDQLADFIVDGQLDLTALDTFLPAGLTADLSRLDQGDRDVPIWRASSDGLFSFASAKSLFRSLQEHPAPDMMLGRCWYKHLPFKVSFLAWRVLRRRLPVVDVLARFGFQIVSRCWCCSHPTLDSILHIFYAGNTAVAVWRYFSGSFGFQLRHNGLRALLTGWRRAASGNRLISFVLCRLPYIILWELWKHRNDCMHGRGTPSVARVIFRVAKLVAECIFRRWPGEHILPPSWPVIMTYLDCHVPRRVIKVVRWFPPPTGSLKVSISLSRSRDGAAALVRNHYGGVYFGVAWSSLGGGIRGLFRVLFDSLRWCLGGGFTSIIVETTDQEFRGFFDLYSSYPWSLDDEIAQLRHFMSRVTLTATLCPRWGNLPCDALAEWVRGRDCEFTFSPPFALPQRVRALISLDGFPSFVFVDADAG